MLTHFDTHLTIPQRCFMILCLFCLALEPKLSNASTNEEYRAAHINQCGSSYLDYKSPQPLNNKNLEIYYLCFEGFAVGYSPVSKTALWSAEYLTRQRIEKANTLERVDNFHEESRLPNRIKAYLTDYQHTPYDRGHLAPNADMATLESQYDSFSLANIVPQNAKNNRSTWRSIESRTRYMAVKYGKIYVVSGVAFTDKNLKKIHNNVLVPSHLYKAIYVPSLKQAGVYYVPNDDSQRIEVISLDELALRTGIDSMPSLPSDIQAAAMPLAVDDYNVSDKNTDKPSDQSNQSLEQLIIVIANLLLAIIKWVGELLKS